MLTQETLKAIQDAVDKAMVDIVEGLRKEIGTPVGETYTIPCHDISFVQASTFNGADFDAVLERIAKATEEIDKC